MILQKIVENRMGENTYVVGDENTKKCIVVDPGANFVDIMNDAASASEDKSLSPIAYI